MTYIIVAQQNFQICSLSEQTYYHLINESILVVASELFDLRYYAQLGKFL